MDEPITGSRVPCTNGQAAGFDCKDVDLLSFLPVPAITNAEAAGHHKHASRPLAQRNLCHDDEGCAGAGNHHVRLNDVWGWTDPESGKEYALVGRSEGTAFVDVSDPVNPVYLGELPTHADTSTWRDIKTYGHYAFIVADYSPSIYEGQHGMQVFDLTDLRDVQNPPVTFSEAAHYDGFGKSHNLYINEQTGFAYAVGSDTYGGGLHIVDIRNPLQPTFAGSFADPRTGRHNTGYSHDVQCVVYNGPDTRYQGREICLGSNETHLSIADVTDKSAPAAISATSYDSVSYTHQGWLTEDQRYFLVDDELDEIDFGFNTRTLIWDVSDLERPVVFFEYFGTTGTTDHNQYVVGDYSYQANYKSGLRILDISDIAGLSIDAKAVSEAAYFDIYPVDDLTGFDGAWSNYPFFESGIVVVSGIGQGLFVLKPTLDLTGTPTEGAEVPQGFDLSPAYPNPFNPRTTLEVTITRPQEIVVTAYDALGRVVARLYDGPLTPGTHRLTFDAAGLPSGAYVVRAEGVEGVITRVVTLVK